jgi:hypothetical protein
MSPVASFRLTGGPAAQNPAGADEVRAAVERVLARPEFQPEKHPLREWVGRRIDGIVDWFRDFFGVSPETASQIVAWVFYLAIALVAVGLLVWLVRTALAAARPDRTASAGAAPADVRAMRAVELAARARAAAARGDHALALRLYFWALVVGLGQSGALEYHDAWTNRELLERGAPAPHVDRALRPLVPELDRKTFGHEPARAEDVARLARLCDEMLGVPA